MKLTLNADLLLKIKCSGHRKIIIRTIISGEQRPNFEGQTQEQIQYWGTRNIKIHF